MGHGNGPLTYRVRELIPSAFVEVGDATHPVEGKVQPLLLHRPDVGRVIDRFRPIATLRWSDDTTTEPVRELQDHTHVDDADFSALLRLILLSVESNGMRVRQKEIVPNTSVSVSTHWVFHRFLTWKASQERIPLGIVSRLKVTIEVDDVPGLPDADVSVTNL